MQNDCEKKSPIQKASFPTTQKEAEKGGVGRKVDGEKQSGKEGKKKEIGKNIFSQYKGIIFISTRTYWVSAGKAGK